MSRLIDADAITNSTELATKIFSLNLTPYIKVDDLLDFIDKLPTIEAVPVVERNKIIDEYMNLLCEHCMQQKNECYNFECPFCTDGCDIIRIAEQMKGGKE